MKFIYDSVHTTSVKNIYMIFIDQYHAVVIIRMNTAENKDSTVFCGDFSTIIPPSPLQLDVVALDTQGDVVWPVEPLAFSWLSSASFYWSVTSNHVKSRLCHLEM